MVFIKIPSGKKQQLSKMNKEKLIKEFRKIRKGVRKKLTSKMINKEIKYVRNKS